MGIYRLYAIITGIVEDVSVALLDNDEEAIEHAKHWARGRHVEIWESDRLVAQIEPPATKDEN
jgi:hypothetical protein